MAQSNNLMWQIAGGIIIAGIVLGTLNGFVNMIQEQRAEIALAKWAKDHAEPKLDPRTLFAPSVQYGQPTQPRQLLPLPNGYRCVNHQLFRELGNGFEQLPDAYAPRYCR